MCRGWPSTYKYSFFIHHLLFRLNGLPLPKDTSAFWAFQLMTYLLIVCWGSSLEILILSLILLFTLISNCCCSINNDYKMTLSFTVVLGWTLPGICCTSGMIFDWNATEVRKRRATGVVPLWCSSPLCEPLVSEGGSQRLVAPMEELHSPSPDVKLIWILGLIKQIKKIWTTEKCETEEN